MNENGKVMFTPPATRLGEISARANVITADAYDIWLMTGGKKILSVKEIMQTCDCNNITAEITHKCMISMIELQKGFG